MALFHNVVPAIKKCVKTVNIITQCSYKTKIKFAVDSQQQRVLQTTPLVYRLPSPSSPQPFSFDLE